MAAGPGAFDFTQGDTNGTTFWRIVRDFLHVPTTEQVGLCACCSPCIRLLAAKPASFQLHTQKSMEHVHNCQHPHGRGRNKIRTKWCTALQVACQAPKPILLDTGSVHLPYSWQPAVTEISIFRVGQVGIFFLSV